jgi:hypothetical protein
MKLPVKNESSMNVCVELENERDSTAHVMTVKLTMVMIEACMPKGAACRRSAKYQTRGNHSEPHPAGRLKSEVRSATVATGEYDDACAGLNWHEALTQLQLLISVQRSVWNAD